MAESKSKISFRIFDLQGAGHIFQTKVIFSHWFGLVSELFKKTSLYYNLLP